jgi:hypothetical protein
MNAENVSERMPGDAEAAGAIAGMQEVYGRPPMEHAVGDWVSWYDASGSLRQGGVIEVMADGYLIVSQVGGRDIVSSNQIARV